MNEHAEDQNLSRLCFRFNATLSFMVEKANSRTKNNIQSLILYQEEEQEEKEEEEEEENKESNTQKRFRSFSPNYSEQRNKKLRNFRSRSRTRRFGANSKRNYN